MFSCVLSRLLGYLWSDVPGQGEEDQETKQRTRVNRDRDPGQTAWHHSSSPLVFLLLSLSADGSSRMNASFISNGTMVKDLTSHGLNRRLRTRIVNKREERPSRSNRGNPENNRSWRRTAGDPSCDQQTPSQAIGIVSHGSTACSSIFTNLVFFSFQTLGSRSWHWNRRFLHHLPGVLV